MKIYLVCEEHSAGYMVLAVRSNEEIAKSLVESLKRRACAIYAGSLISLYYGYPTEKAYEYASRRFEDAYFYIEKELDGECEETIV